ncbi:MAG: hypothetical protein CSA35_06220 [Dethiosulfovibrio peptidovorans]|nr:MAG: hypothetical protein CSA35_06220 [Dethiosulfovibrio peptidovorans]
MAFYGEVTGASVHIVHVSSALGASRIALARGRGVDITGETCPQYLVLTDAVYEETEGHLYSASPALRKDRDRAALWKALRIGGIDFVATDHCPFTREQKTWTGDFADLPYGIAGVETSLPLVYSFGVGAGLLPLETLPVVMSQAPADRYALPGKGRILPGYDADLVLFDPQARWSLSASKFHMNVDFCPYEGMEVRGRVVSTFSRGEEIYCDGELCCEPGRGRYLFRAPRPKVR